MTTIIFTCRCVNISGIPHLNGQLGKFNPESDNKPWTCGIVRGNILDSTGQNPHLFLFHIIWVWKKGYPIPFAAWKFFVSIGVAISQAYSIPYTQLSDTPTVDQIYRFTILKFAIYGWLPSKIAIFHIIVMLVYQWASRTIFY